MEVNCASRCREREVDEAPDGEGLSGGGSGLLEVVKNVLDKCICGLSREVWWGWWG